MQILIGTILGLVGFSLSFFYYKRKRPVPLPKTKPRMVLFPKYASTSVLPQEILGSSNPIQEVSATLEPLGFSEFRRGDSQVVYTRGKALGDILFKLMKVNVALTLPLQESTKIQIEYGTYCFFDFGALWLFSNSLLTFPNRAAQIEAESAE